LKVGILTFHYNVNFGAVLQAAAFVRFLRQAHIDAELIDYRPFAYVRKRVASYLLLGKQDWIALPTHFPVARGLWDKIRLLRYLKRAGLTSAKTFWRKNTTMFMPYDTVVCGSDQVWKIDHFRGEDLCFFLPFTKREGQRKIGCAITLPIISSRHHDEDIKAYVRDFDCMTVRDQLTQRYVADVTGRMPEIISDPCMLVDYDAWLSTYPKSNAGYCLTYMQGKITKQLRTALSQFVIHKGWEQRDIDMHGIGGLEQTVCLFRDAQHIITNTYHGLMLAIMFRKSFTYIQWNIGKAKCIDFLERYHLQQHIVPSNHTWAECYMQPPAAESIALVEKDIEATKKKLLEYIND
jgi:hypothetical protein